MKFDDLTLASSRELEILLQQRTGNTPPAAHTDMRTSVLLK